MDNCARAKQEMKKLSYCAEAVQVAESGRVISARSGTSRLSDCVQLTGTRPRGEDFDDVDPGRPRLTFGKRDSRTAGLSCDLTAISD